MSITEKIIVKYQTYEEYCSCCGREFEEEELGAIREFDIRIQDIFEWAQWYSAEDIYEEEIESTIDEYIYDTIRFYALESNEDLKLCEGELKKVIEKVLLKIKNNDY